jgi:disulfide bond formation protein DsbB
MTQEKESLSVSKICRTCIVIRMFIIAMLILVITGLLAKDKMHHLSFLTTWNVAIAIMIFGSISFIIKFIFWKLENKSKTNDPLQND